LVWSFAVNNYVMISVLLLLTVIGTFLGYSTSEKVVVSKKTFLDVLLNKPFAYKKIVGGLLLIVGLLISIQCNGVTSGIFIWIFMLTIVMSLLVILYPLQLIKTVYVFSLLVLLILTELILNYAS